MNDRVLSKTENFGYAPKLNKLVHIIDDDAQGSEVLALWLEINGYSVHCDFNGEEALNYLKSGPLPSIILLNLKMPRIDGFEFRSRQINDPRLAEIPVVIVSAFDQWDVRRKLIQAKPDAYVQKPFDINHILETVQRYSH